MKLFLMSEEYAFYLFSTDSFHNQRYWSELSTLTYEIGLVFISMEYESINATIE